MKKFGKLLFGSLLAGVMTFGVSGLTVASANSEPETAKTPVNYYKGSTVNSTLESNGLYYTDGNYFNAIRWENTTSQGGAADSNWWGWNNVYMGVADATNPLDLTNSKFTMEVYGVTNNSTWVTFQLVDADGDLAQMATSFIDGVQVGSGTLYKSVTFDGYREGGEELTAYSDPSSDWRGVFIGARHGKLTVTPWDTTGTTDAQGTTNTAYYNFDWNKVVAISTRIHTYDAKTIEFGKIGVVTNEVETTVFDPAQATALTAIPADGIKAMTKNQYLFAPNYDQIKAGKTVSDLTTATSEFVTVAYKPYKPMLKADKNTWYIEKTKSAGDAWAPVFEWDETNNRESATFTDVTGYEGVKIDIDTTGLTNDFMQADFLIRLKNADNSTTDYKAFGNTVNATFIREDGTVYKNADFKKGSNWFPKNFVGTVYFPFGAFENGSTLLTSVEDFATKITAMRIIFLNNSMAVGDKVTFTNYQAYDCVEHEDVNHDQLCDYCACEVPCTEHVDEDDDLACDYCDAELPCTEHVDEDGDDVCDKCDEFCGDNTQGGGSTGGDNTQGGGTTEEPEKGCFGSVFGLNLALVAIVGSAVLLRKKED